VRVLVRELQSQAEAKALAELTVSAYAALPGDHLGDGYEEELRDVAGRAAKATVLVAVDGDRILGGVTYVPGPGPLAEHAEPDDAQFRMLAVSAEARGRGVGEQLVRACIARARAYGRGRLALYTSQHMTVAHRLYERLGFRRVPEDDWQVNDHLTLLRYVLDLEEPMREELTADTFEPHVGARFTIDLDDRSVSLELAKVRRYERQEHAPRPEAFAVMFVTDEAFGQGLYTFRHEALGEVGIFVVPVGPGADGRLQYEAIFN